MSFKDKDKLLAALGRLAAEQEREGAKWESTVRGDTSPDELFDPHRDEGLLAAARPLDEAARERITKNLVGKLSPAKYAVKRARWSSRLGMAVGGFALAASLGFLVLHDHDEPLPFYSFDPTTLAKSRSPAPHTATRPPCALRADARGSFELVARPETAMKERKVTARVFVLRGSTLSPWAGDVELSDSGSVRVFGSNESLLGATELRVVVDLTSDTHPLEDRARAAVDGPTTRVISCAVVHD
jgi:hypothetical protein